MKKRVCVLVVALLLLVCLSGCIRTSTTLTISASGKVDISSLFAVSQEFDQTGASDQFQWDDSKETYEKKGFAYDTYADEKNGFTGYTITKKDVDLEDLSCEDGKADLQAAFEGKIFTVNGRHVSMRFTPFTDMDEDTASSLSMLGYADGYMRYQVTFPVKPTNHNATSVSDDGKTLTWNLTKFGPGEEIYAEFNKPLLPAWVWWILIGLAACVVCFVIILLCRKAIGSKKSHAPQGAEGAPVQAGAPILPVQPENPLPPEAEESLPAAPPVIDAAAAPEAGSQVREAVNAAQQPAEEQLPETGSAEAPQELP